MSVIIEQGLTDPEHALTQDQCVPGLHVRVGAWITIRQPAGVILSIEDAPPWMRSYWESARRRGVVPVRLDAGWTGFYGWWELEAVE